MARPSVATAMPLQSLTTQDLLSCRDLAWEKTREGTEQTAEVYESWTHLNNAVLMNGRWLVSIREIPAGSEVFLTKGWAWYEQLAHLAKRPRESEAVSVRVSQSPPRSSGLSSGSSGQEEQSA